MGELGQRTSLTTEQLYQRVSASFEVSRRAEVLYHFDWELMADPVRRQILDLVDRAYDQSMYQEAVQWARPPPTTTIAEAQWRLVRP